MEYAELTNRYPVFYYHDFALIESDDEFRVQYDFEIEGLSHFNPDFIIPKPAGGGLFGNLRNVRVAAFSLGMVELISYWKMTCSPHVIVECGALSSQQISWWKNLYYQGLDEFFAHNGIDADPEGFMDLSSSGDVITGQIDQRRFFGNLIPVGGGKNSFVTLELLKDTKEDNHTFVISHVMSAIHAAFAAGYRGEHLIIADRSLDSRMLEFNKRGFLNGPTPFSALCAFAASLTAIIYGIQNICLSNEDILGQQADNENYLHLQYSKTFAFEQDFKQYMDTWITPEVHYFSVLRPVSDLQIAGLFATLKQYHPVFRSCNVGQKEEKWCGHCLRCLLTCIMLSAYLDDEALVEIFHSDMLNDPQMREMFDELTGASDNHPAGCSGIREEVNVAICMSIRRHEHAGSGLPLLYREYQTSSYYDFYRGKSVDWDHFNPQNYVPEQYSCLLKNWLMERKTV